MSIIVERRQDVANRQDYQPSLPAIRWVILGRFDRLHKAARNAVIYEYEYGRHGLSIPIFLGLGAILWFCVPTEPVDIAVWVLLAASVFAWWAIAPSGHFQDLAVRAIILMCIGMAAAMVETRRSGTILLDSPVMTIVTGDIISREIDHKGDWRYRLAVRTTEAPTLKRAPEQVSILVRGGDKPLGIGQTIKVRARLSPPSGPAFPGLNDFAFDAYYTGTGAIGYALGPVENMSPISDAHPDLATKANQIIEDVRGEIGRRIRAVLPGDAGAFATAIVTDERRAISPETTEALRLAGLAHIIAISGLNMALAAGIFFVGLRSLLSLSVGLAHRHAIKKIAAFGAMLAVTAYYLVSGFGVSAERAYLMMMVMLTAVLFDVSAISLRNVGISAVVIVLFAPSAIMGPSFQMSFAATAALVAGYSLLSGRKADAHDQNPLPVLKWLRPIWQFTSGVFVTSLIGGMSTAVYSVEHFHRLAAFGLLANLLSMPIISFVVMPAALIAMLAMPFGLETWPLMAMGWGLDIVIACAKWSASLGGDVVVGKMPDWVMPIYSAGFLVFVVLASRLRMVGLTVMVLTISSWMVFGGAQKPDIIVSEDGKIAALISDVGLFYNREKPPDFIADQWQRALAMVAGTKPRITGKAPDRNLARQSLTKEQIGRAAEQMRDAAMPDKTDRVGKGQDRAVSGPFSCRRGVWCIGRQQEGLVIALLDDTAFMPAACQVASIIVTPYYWRQTRCDNDVPIISRDILRARGSLAISCKTPEKAISQNPSETGPSPPGRDCTMTIRGALDGQRRSWNAHRLYDWRQDQFALPPSLDANGINQ